MATAYIGRVGDIITEVLDLYNDDDQDVATDARCLRMIRKGVKFLAEKGVFTKTSSVSLVADQQDYDLWSLVEDMVQVWGVRYDDGTTSYALTEMQTKEEFEWFKNALSNTTGTMPYMYFADGGVMSLLPCPSASTTDAIKLDHTYLPRDVYGTNSFTLAGAAVDLGDGTVKVPCASHPFLEGDVLLFDSTTAYDGTYTLPDQSDGDEDNFVITAVYVGETFASPDVATITSPLLTSPPTPKVFDPFYVYFVLSELYSRDNTRPLADQNRQKYEGLYWKEFRRLYAVKGQSRFSVGFPR